jgi:hypothetical protein
MDQGSVRERISPVFIVTAPGPWMMRGTNIYKSNDNNNNSSSNRNKNNVESQRKEHEIGLPHGTGIV